MEKRLKVWMITKWYPNREDPQIGVYIRKHAQAIGLYHSISVLYIHSHPELKNKFETDESEIDGVKEIKIYFRKNQSFVGRIINASRYLQAARKGIRILDKVNPHPDIIHAYILARTGVLAWFISERRKIPYVISEQWSGYVTGKFRQSMVLKKMLCRFLIRKAAAVTSVSKFLMENMKACGLQNMNYHVIPNIIETVSEGAEKNNSGQTEVLMVADLVDDIKNVSGVIRMIASLDTNIPFRLKIIGKGPDGEMLMNLTKQYNLLDRKIFFEGIKTNDDVYEYLKKTDFLLMNSRFETFSLICAEAMSCGKPVLATRCGGPDEFVRPQTGILIEPGNEDELKKNFQYMLNHFHEFDQEKIKKYAEELFSKEKAARSFATLYSNLKK